MEGLWNKGGILHSKSYIPKRARRCKDVSSAPLSRKQNSQIGGRFMVFSVVFATEKLCEDDCKQKIAGEYVAFIAKRGYLAMVLLWYRDVV